MNASKAAREQLTIKYTLGVLTPGPQLETKVQYAANQKVRTVKAE
jgi:hypothetical protein